MAFPVSQPDDGLIDVTIMLKVCEKKALFMVRLTFHRAIAETLSRRWMVARKESVTGILK